MPESSVNMLQMRSLLPKKSQNLTKPPQLELPAVNPSISGIHAPQISLILSHFNSFLISSPPFLCLCFWFSFALSNYNEKHLFSSPSLVLFTFSNNLCIYRNWCISMFPLPQLLFSLLIFHTVILKLIQYCSITTYSFKFFSWGGHVSRNLVQVITLWNWPFPTKEICIENWSLYELQFSRITELKYLCNLKRIILIFTNWNVKIRGHVSLTFS